MKQAVRRIELGVLFGVSGAGMGALELARSSGTPLLALLGEQPEQARNVAELIRRTPDFALRSVLVGDPDLAMAVTAAAEAFCERRPSAAALGRAGGEEVWVRVFDELVRAARLRATARHRLVTRPRAALGPGIS